MLPALRPLFFGLLIASILGTAVLGATEADDSSGSYFVVYAGDAPASCVLEDGEQVDDSCCTNVGPQFGLVRDSFASTCFVISGLLGENGGSLQSYLGCDGDNQMPTYGEACYLMGAENGGIIPPGTVVEDTNTTTIDECGCTFQVSGNGCHKIRDFSALPGFENDTRQVYLYMKEHCADDVLEESSPDDDPSTEDESEDASAAARDSGKLWQSLLFSAVAVIGLNVA